MTNRLPRSVPGMLLVIALMAGPALPAAEDTGMTAELANNAPGMRGLVYGFFEDHTGRKIGRLRIDSVDVEYGRQGFLKVAWRPLVVLSGVTLDLAEGADWRSAGAQILQALKAAGRREACVLRNVRLRLAGAPAREIVAPTATLRSDGGLELQGPVAGGASGATADNPGTLCFWLSGPLAGQLTPPPAAASGATLANLNPGNLDPTAR